MKKQKGFTLIELLVVIAIIAILSTVVMAGLNSARAKGRDAKRLSDVKSLQKALDLYQDTCGGYPALGTTDTYADIDADPASADDTTLRVLTQDGTCTTSGETFGTYMNPLPATPQPGGADYQYCSTPSDAADPKDPGNCDSDVATNPNANSSYQITFSIEMAAGSLAGPDAYVATPSGLQAA